MKIKKLDRVDIMIVKSKRTMTNEKDKSFNHRYVKNPFYTLLNV